MIKPINHDLKTLSIPASPATPSDKAVISDLLDTLQANSATCVGMAANMIGVNKQIIVVQIGPFAVPMVNPKVVKRSDPYLTSEGCLSLSGERPTTRYHHVTVQYLDRQFQPQEQAFDDFAAQIIQHEVDHCNGILI
ncbi:peptide deformylase [Levilactobacillus bambusae]|uniref:Peptide deformylase n=1 Tax=Levilactobacillus bambusae TaxID=2024736 RepID=A0A2V1N242_9LACO|nr:peptide deformylase [Levilactobacillus bambusae]PWG00395.1 peptide deformylase [Levilactobacillus bambusae]